MSYTMTHLVIGSRLAELLDIKDKKEFLLGTISPDAVHVRTDYDKRMKAFSHFMPEDMEWGTEESWIGWERWIKNALDCYGKIREAAGGGSDFEKGYLAHVLTDALNGNRTALRARREHPYAGQRVWQEELTELDRFYYLSELEVVIALKKLKDAAGQAVAGRVSQEEILLFKEQILGQYRDMECCEVDENYIFKPEDNDAFIKEAVAFVLQIMKKM